MAKPTTYTDELAEALIDGLWEGKTIPEIQQDHPELKRQTISDWCRDRPAFGARYREAMVGGAHHMVDETKTIADNLQEPPESRRIRIHQRMEMAKRKAPAEFSEKFQLNHSGAVGTYDLSNLTDEQLDRLESILGPLAVAGRNSGGEAEEEG